MRADMDKRMDGNVAVVTGGGGLIGSEIAATLARSGARVVVVDLAADLAANAAATIQAFGGEALAVTADIANEAAVDRMLRDVVAQFGRLDSLVCAAAPLSLVLREKPLADSDVEAWDEIMRVMLRGTMLCARSAVPLMIESGGGSIVNISSVHAFAADMTLVAYPAAKAAIIALTRTIATQYGRDNVRCNAVCPGTIPPPGMVQEDLERRLRHQVIARPGAPVDVANAVRFLLSDEGSFISGEVLQVDGGVLIHLPSYADGGNFKSAN
jgi:NAD(P)-dependent dehydrogenase (short-subunit alcohol dehydrogenase family)